MNYHKLVKTTNQDEIFYIKRSSHRRCPVKRGVPKSFPNFTGVFQKNTYFEEYAGTAASHIKSKLKLWHNCFTINFAKFLRILENASRRLLQLFVKFTSNLARKKKKKFNYERDGGRYHIETSPLDWVLYDNGLRHERVNETE